MDNVRYNISPCSNEEAQGFIARIEDSAYSLRNTVRADERSHYDRYTFVRDDVRVAVVYDTTAKVISITSTADSAQELLDLFGADDTRTVKRSTVPAQGAAKADKERQTEQAPVMRAKIFVSADTLNRRGAVDTSTVIATSKGAEISTDEIYPPQRAKRLAEHMQEREQAYKRSLELGERAILPPDSSSDMPEYYPAKAFYGDFIPADADRADKLGAAPQSDERNEPKPPAPDRDGRNATEGDRAGITISVGTAQSGKPRKATISFGDYDDDFDKRRAPVGINTRPVGGTGLFADMTAKPQAPQSQTQPQQQSGGVQSGGDRQTEPTQKRRRGRPPKNNKPPVVIDENGDPVKRKRGRPPKETVPEVAQPKPVEFIARNFSKKDMAAMFNWLKRTGRTIVPDLTEADSAQQIISYMVSNAAGNKVRLRFATAKSAVQITGLQSALFESLKTRIETGGAQGASKRDNAAPVQSDGGNQAADARQAPKQQRAGGAVNDKFKPLQRRIPTAFEYLSEQSKADFACGLHDFSQRNLSISDYSVLLVPPFRALERFVFDLQRSEGIVVKMIGQAFDKDDDGKYILKRGYQQRIGSIVYAEVMVALYTEYFSQRNFFAHTDNTGENVSRSISDKQVAKQKFEHLLDVVEYNAAKLKEIGYKINAGV